MTLDRELNRLRVKRIRCYTSMNLCHIRVVAEFDLRLTPIQKIEKTTPGTCVFGIIRGITGGRLDPSNSFSALLSHKYCDS